MQYPLSERIGEPDLLTGREKEFKLFHKWIKNIPKKLSKSRVILARRKSGKTSFIQRLFNELWSENGKVIPLFFDIAENKIWYPDFAIEYYCTFASQYISFLERDETLIKRSLSLKQIKAYGKANSIEMFVEDVDFILYNKENSYYGAVWKTAHTAPDRFAAVLNIRFLVIIDEFQNITEYVYRDEQCETAKDKTMAGSFHSVSESKLAPMLVTGSYVGWLVSIIDQYLEAGRLKRTYMNPYLTNEEGLQAVYKYAQYFEEDITNESATQINQLCQSDPFFISCVIQSDYEGKNLITTDGVVNTVNYEISDRRSEMSMTWTEYIELTLKKVNDIYAKNILLHMSKYKDREWTPSELKKELELPLDLSEIKEKLNILAKADFIKEGNSDIRFQGLQDGTLYLVLRNRFEEEINSYIPDLKNDFNKELETLKKDKLSLQGKLNNLIGKFAEYQLATDIRTRKRFPLSVYFSGVKDLTVLNIIDVTLRVKFQRSDGKEMEIDIVAKSDCGRVILIEVKKTKSKIGYDVLKDFKEKIASYIDYHSISAKNILSGFLSVGGFTEDAIGFCKQNNIGSTERIEYYLS